jgi:hypothetical protein
MASIELLRALDAGHAFDPVPLPGHRAALYVPFDELVEGEHEAGLHRELANVQRVAFVGPIGSGKSSMIEYALADGADEFAPIWVEVANQPDEVLVEPAEFARHLIRVIVAWSRQARTLSVAERHTALLETSRKLPVRTQREKQTMSLKLALHWLEPGWTDEIEQTVADPELDRSPDDFIDSLDRLVALIEQDLGRVPVVVLDDSGRWLGFPSQRQERVLTGFFCDTCRMLAQRNWAVVMAVHPGYTTGAGFETAAANGYFNVRREVPSLLTPEALRAIFDLRVRLVSGASAEQDLLDAGAATHDVPEASVDDVFEPGFERVLLDYYRATGGSLRSVLTVVEQAVRQSVGLAEPLVTIETVREAMLAQPRGQ